MRVYTKTGDKGTTSLIGGSRVRKDDIRLEIYGTLDELDSFIGLLKNEPGMEEYREDLQRIQGVIFSLNCIFASENEEMSSRFTIKREEVEFLEKRIDTYDSQLEPITEFLIPGENRCNALCNVCRTICRRAERRIYKLELNSTEQGAAKYINRLSDFLFILGRITCK